MSTSTAVPEPQGEHEHPPVKPLDEGSKSTNTSAAKVAAPTFQKGDEVVLAEGEYKGTLGIFLQLDDDPKWAKITERNGSVRSHPVKWLAHSTSATPGRESEAGKSQVTQ
jgi:hypothetical protein